MNLTFKCPNCKDIITIDYYKDHFRMSCISCDKKFNARVVKEGDKLLVKAKVAEKKKGKKAEKTNNTY